MSEGQSGRGCQSDGRAELNRCFTISVIILSRNVKLKVNFKLLKYHPTRAVSRESVNSVRMVEITRKKMGLSGRAGQGGLRSGGKIAIRRS